MATVKEQMLKAQDLIKAKRYDEARKILVKIDHPKAQEWLAKIDELDSGFDDPFADIAPVAKPKTQSRRVASSEMGDIYPVVSQFVKKGWVVVNQTETTANLEMKPKSGCAAFVLGVPAIFLFVFVDIVIGIIALLVVMALIALNNATKRTKTVNVVARPGGAVAVSSSVKRLNQVYEAGNMGRVKT
jgi:hypothetical protein